MEQCFQASKEVEELQKLQLHKNPKGTDKYQNVHAKVVTNFRDKKKHESYNLDRVSTDKVEIDKQNGANTFENDKKVSSIKKIVDRTNNIERTNNNVSSRQKRAGKHKSPQKFQSKVSSEPNIHKFDNAANGLDEQNMKYKNQGIQTLDTDQLESIYSEGVIR